MKITFTTKWLRCQINRDFTMYRQDLCKMVFFKSLDKNDLKKIEAENQTFSRLVLNFQSLYYKQTKKEIASFEEAVHFKYLFFGGFLTYDTLTCKHEYITAQFCSRHCVGNLVSCLTGLLRMKEKKKRKNNPTPLCTLLKTRRNSEHNFYQSLIKAVSQFALIYGHGPS